MYLAFVVLSDERVGSLLGRWVLVRRQDERLLFVPVLLCQLLVLLLLLLTDYLGWGRT